MQKAQPGVPPAESAHTFTRASDGKTRVDTGNISVISNPATAQTILLDHVKKTATIQPAPPPPPGAPALAMPQMPGFAPPKLPGAPPPPTPPPVEDLGKRLLQGHEVEGKRFVTQPPPLPKPPVFQMPAAPKPPGLQVPGAPKLAPPKIPGVPPIPGMKMPALNVPGAPKMPAVQMPGAPKPPAGAIPGAPPPPAMPGAPPVPPTPQPPLTTEVWSSTSLAVPMLTKVSGSFGQITQVCKKMIPGEPHPSTFQIPPGYKVTG